jgi:GntR family transcriptional regulator
MEFRQNQPIYLQIADHINERILSETWGEGGRIPSIREMSEAIEVNPNTVMRSYNYLQDLGIIYNQRGIGYFVAEGAYHKTLELKKRSFIRRELPRMFRTMDLLNLTCEDLRSLYREYARDGSAQSGRGGKQ